MRFFIIFFCSVTPIFSQTEIQPDLKPSSEMVAEMLMLTNPDTNDIVDVFKLAQKYYDINLDTALLLAEKSVEWTKKSQDKDQCCQAMIILAEITKLSGETDASLSILDEVKELAAANKSDESSAAINCLYGNIALDKGETEEAISYFLDAVKFYESSGNKFALADTYAQIRGVFFDTNQLGKCKVYNAKIEIIAEELDDDDLRIDVGGSEGIYLMTKGIHYYLNNQLDTANLQQTIDTLNNYFQRSEIIYDESLALARKENKSKWILTLLNNMVALANNMEKNERAEKLALEAKEIAEKLQYDELIVQSNINLSSVYLRRNDFNLALKYAKEAHAAAKESNIDRKIALANMRLYDLYIAMKKYKEALYVAEEIRAYDLKISNVDNARAIAEIETKYETIKKEQQILQLESNNHKIKSQRNYILGGGFILGLLAFFGIRINKLRKERNDKKAFSEALIGAQEDERKKIARDLHDGIGQSLLLIKKQMEKTAETTETNRKLISETLEEVRSLSRDLHPFQLDKFGLTATVEEMIQKIQGSTGLFITIDIENIDERIPEPSTIHVFRTIQEALSNIVKHAEASAAKITFKQNEDNTVIRIQDNGSGFDQELTLAKRKSLGLKTMHERMTIIGGKFQIDNGDPKGTIVTLTIPKLN